MTLEAKVTELDKVGTSAEEARNAAAEDLAQERQALDDATAKYDRLGRHMDAYQLQIHQLVPLQHQPSLVSKSKTG